MNLTSYINTINYKQRITSLLEDEAKRLTPKEFSQFSIPLEQELDRLEGEIAEYEMQSTPTVLTCSVCHSSFSRWMLPYVKATASIWMNGATRVPNREEGQYILSDQLLYQDNWEGSGNLQSIASIHRPEVTLHA